MLCYVSYNAKVKFNSNLVTEKVRLMNTFPWRMGKIPEIKDTQFFFGFSFNPLHHSKPSQIQGSFVSQFFGPALLSVA